MNIPSRLRFTIISLRIAAVLNIIAGLSHGLAVFGIGYLMELYNLILPAPFASEYFLILAGAHLTSAVIYEHVIRGLRLGRYWAWIVGVITGIQMLFGIYIIFGLLALLGLSDKESRAFFKTPSKERFYTKELLIFSLSISFIISYGLLMFFLSPNVNKISNFDVSRLPVDKVEKIEENKEDEEKIEAPSVVPSDSQREEVVVDSGKGLIEKYYEHISNGELQTAYDMKIEPSVDFKTFDSWYSEVVSATPHSFKATNSENQFLFNVDLTEKDGLVSHYEVVMEVESEKLKTINSKEVTNNLDVKDTDTYQNLEGYKIVKRFDDLDCDNSQAECKNKMWDQSLVFYDENGDKEIIIESIKDALPELKDRFNYILVDYSFPKDGDQLFFASIADASSSGYMSLYSFETSKREFSDIKSRSKIWLNGGEISPNGQIVASVVGDELTINPDNLYQEGIKLKVLYLAEDRIETVLELKENESLFEYWTEFGPTPVSNINWIDDQTIQYSVYDSSKSFKSGDEPRRLIEKRQVEL